MISAIIAIMGAFFVAYIVWVYVLALIYDYRLTEKAIEVVLFRTFPLMRFKFDTIIEIRTFSFRDGVYWNSFGAWRLGNRCGGVPIFVRRSEGFIRSIVITPKNTDEFMKLVGQKVPL